MSDSSDRLIVLSLGPKSRVLSMAPDGSDVQVLVDNLESKPDGVTIDPRRRHLFYTFMGTTRTGDGDFWENEGYIERANYDGSRRKVIVPASQSMSSMLRRATSPLRRPRSSMQRTIASARSIDGPPWPRAASSCSTSAGSSDLGSDDSCQFAGYDSAPTSA